MVAFICFRFIWLIVCEWLFMDSYRSLYMRRVYASCRVDHKWLHIGRSWSLIARRWAFIAVKEWSWQSIRLYIPFDLWECFLTYVQKCVWLVIQTVFMRTFREFRISVPTQISLILWCSCFHIFFTILYFFSLHWRKNYNLPSYFSLASFTGESIWLI